MKSIRWLGILLVGLFLISCGRGVTYPIYLRYQPSKDFPGLQQKMGPTLAMAPFKDDRQRNLTSATGPSRVRPTSLRATPFPEKAIQDSLTQVLSRQGIKTVAVPDWDGKPESLKGLEADFILKIEIKEFWSQGRATAVGTKIKTSIRLAIHLGVKRNEKFIREISKSRRKSLR